MKLTDSPSPQFLTPWSLPCPPSVQWLVAWEDWPDRWSAPTTTSRWGSLSATQTRSLQQNRSVTLHPAPTTASASTTSLTDILRIQDAIPATAAGMCPQQTTSGGPDPGEQYVQTVLLCRNVFSCGRCVLEILVRMCVIYIGHSVLVRYRCSFHV